MCSKEMEEMNLIYLYAFYENNDSEIAKKLFSLTLCLSNYFIYIK
jgi:hypothetical protein